jgi:hypothetical protein
MIAAWEDVDEADPVRTQFSVRRIRRSTIAIAEVIASEFRIVVQ